MKTCDLHCHSIFSDGSMSPTELISLAEKQGLSALALTDHNTTKGLKEFMKAGENSPVTTVAGCEFSTEIDGNELHIVGLFMPEESWVEIEDYVELLHMAKHHSNVKLIQNLQDAGYEITYEEVTALTDADEFNRAHVARVLVSHGYAKTVPDAFDKFLRESCGFYSPARKPGAYATTRFIKANGGVAVWAHPFFNYDEKTVESMLAGARKAGLDAMETLYCTYTPEQTKQAKALAEKYGLLESGGSDFHGAAKPDIQLGCGYGNLKIPYSLFEELKKRAE
ncbi:MAG: PHP domain-containing protein [Clostridia bacterium]|nr:PHP domain-containing protein [Clostridia bacterium]